MIYAALHYWTFLKQSSKNYVVTGTTYDSAFSASLALRFNAGQQLGSYDLSYLKGSL